MGISIYYKGRLKDKKSLPKLIDEVKDISEIQNWSYHIFDREFPEKNIRGYDFSKLYGINFVPPGSEPVDLTFLSNEKMCSTMVCFLNRDSKNVDTLFEGCIVKTQYAGPEIHKLIIHLLDHLSKKYFQHFELTDEAEYWESRDDKLLYKNFQFMDNLINNFGNKFESMGMEPGESFENYILRIAKDLKKEQDNKK